MKGSVWLTWCITFTYNSVHIIMCMQWLTCFWFTSECFPEASIKYVSPCICLKASKPTSESSAHHGGILPADSFPFWVSLNSLLATSTGFLIPDRNSSISITFAQDSFKYSKQNLYFASPCIFWFKKIQRSLQQKAT